MIYKVYLSNVWHVRQSKYPLYMCLHKAFGASVLVESWGWCLFICEDAVNWMCKPAQPRGAPLRRLFCDARPCAFFLSNTVTLVIQKEALSDLDRYNAELFVSVLSVRKQLLPKNRHLVSDTSDRTAAMRWPHVYKTTRQSYTESAYEITKNKVQEKVLHTRFSAKT